LLRGLILKSIYLIWVIILLRHLTALLWARCSIILIRWIIVRLYLRIPVLRIILISWVVLLNWILRLTVPRVYLLRLSLILLVWRLTLLISFLLFLFKFCICVFLFFLLCFFFLFLLVFFLLFFSLFFLFFLSFFHLIICFFHHRFNIRFLKLINEIIWIKLVWQTPRRFFRLSKTVLIVTRRNLVLVVLTLILIKLRLLKLWILKWFWLFVIARILRITIRLKLILWYSKRTRSYLLADSIFQSRNFFILSFSSIIIYFYFLKILRIYL
jgi:hypothetical protein